jgi:hypothetical protein
VDVLVFPDTPSFAARALPILPLCAFTILLPALRPTFCLLLVPPRTAGPGLERAFAVRPVWLALLFRVLALLLFDRPGLPVFLRPPLVLPAWWLFVRLGICLDAAPFPATTLEPSIGISGCSFSLPSLDEMSSSAGKV